MFRLLTGLGAVACIFTYRKKETDSNSRALDELRVNYIELTSPVSSDQSRQDCETIVKLGFRAKILTHVRCNFDDAQIAVETGVHGVDVVV